MDIIEWLESFLQSDSTKLIYILTLILIMNTIDFIIGWLKARFNPEITFSSSRAVYGIARKIILFILLIVFIPFSLLIPRELGISALYILYLGYLGTEVSSVLNHLGLNIDNKDGIFYDFLDKIFKGTNEREEYRIAEKRIKQEDKEDRIKTSRTERMD